MFKGKVHQIFVFSGCHNGAPRSQRSQRTNWSPPCHKTIFVYGPQIHSFHLFHPEKIIETKKPKIRQLKHTKPTKKSLKIRKSYGNFASYDNTNSYVWLLIEWKNMLFILSMKSCHILYSLLVCICIVYIMDQDFSDIQYVVQHYRCTV